MSGHTDSGAGVPSRAEVRRRWRESAVIVVILLAVLLYAYFEVRLPQVGRPASFGTDAVLILLANINLILLVLLVFLVGRNIFKLILDRRRGVMGAHLRTRLVVAFVATVLLPTTLLFLVAQSFVGNSIERWFNREVERALKGSLEVAHTYYKESADRSLAFAERIAAQIARTPTLLDPPERHRLGAFLDARRGEYELDLLQVFARGRRVAASREVALVGSGRLGTTPFTPIVRTASMGTHATARDRVGKTELIRAATPILRDGEILGVVVVNAVVPEHVVKRRESIDRSLSEYLSLKIQRRPIQTAYTIALVLVTLVGPLAATWLAFYLARGITVPIQRLAEGTRAVAQGDLDVRIAGSGDDELGTLVSAFNVMTHDLKANRTELDARRRYLETVLANVAAGVVSTEAHGIVTTMNPVAGTLLGLDPKACLGRPLLAVLANPLYAEIRGLVAALLDEATARETPAPSVDGHVTIDRPRGRVAAFLTGTRLVDDFGRSQGVVLFLEDVTHLLRVERMEAWREVARRIAHEIKNPLTPIQLSAQRLRRRYGARLGEDGTIFDESTRTIIQQVETLKAMVNEFAVFARMPAAEHLPADVNPLIEEVLVLYREAHPDIRFTFARPAVLPDVEIDRDGVRRVLINILDNAVAALATLSGDGERVLEVQTSHDVTLGVVRIEIADNGPGVSAEARLRLFEPYFSTKPEGTGLGLAIVSAIMADHKGFVRVRDNHPRGTRFVLEFPVRPAQSAARASLGAYGTG
jgi:two-component system nitrogen regulation sensor histidine kinase NtrY